MLDCFTKTEKDAIEIELISSSDYKKWQASQSAAAKKWLNAHNITEKAGSHCVLPAKDGSIDKVIAVYDETDSFYLGGKLAQALPSATYHLMTSQTKSHLANLALSWGMQAYQFTKYKKGSKDKAKLFIPRHSYNAVFHNQLDAIYLVRDLINTPCEEMGPEDLAKATKALAKPFKARVKEVVGENLLKKNFPAIHAVGRASASKPRLIEMTWGNKKHPEICLVGKGVCFDSGGLDLKHAAGMRHMKKDMGGAAHALGLAQMLMTADLPIHLRVIISAVENAVSGNAYRPGDVIKTRKGLSVEIGNTDAEGRVVLSDALTLASESKPELIIDFATLTGAARIAVGADISAMFSNTDQIAKKLVKLGHDLNDPIWQLPLHQPYKKMLESSVSDLNNAPGSGYGGAITAALFLQEFVGENIPWIHFDLMAWNLKSTPGCPVGGEAMSLRAVFHYLQSQYS